MSEELNPEQIARDIKTLRDEGAEIDAEEKRLGLTYAPDSPASGGYFFRAIAARYEALASRAALGSRGPQEEPQPSCPYCGETCLPEIAIALRRDVILDRERLDDIERRASAPRKADVMWLLYLVNDLKNAALRGVGTPQEKEPMSEHPAEENYIWVLEHQILPNVYGLKAVALRKAIAVLKSLPVPAGPPHEKSLRQLIETWENRPRQASGSRDECYGREVETFRNCAAALTAAILGVGTRQYVTCKTCGNGIAAVTPADGIDECLDCQERQSRGVGTPQEQV